MKGKLFTTNVFPETHEDLKAIAKQLSEEKNVPVSLTRAVKIVVDFYKEQHKDVQ